MHLHLGFIQGKITQRRSVEETDNLSTAFSMADLDV